MGRNLSPAVRRELENLDKDAESRKMAMKALKSYVKDLDKKAIPQFLAQVSETKAPSSSSVEHTISLYEVLARTHGPNIVPQITNIMSTIIKTLASSAGSFPLQQACSKVVPAIARYGIDPSTPLEKKRDIIHLLCRPLSDCLLGSQEALAFGAALCLKALVDSDNWRFASDEIVNEVCLRVAGALEEKLTQTNSHMGLVMALAKHNNFTVEAYARSLIRSGLRILNVGLVEGNSQKRLSAIQMVNYLMKSLDRRSILSELDIVIAELEKCDNDQMAFVKGAAFEALQTAKLIAAERKPTFERDSSSVTGSNFGRSSRRKNSWASRDRSPVLTSPESQTVDSFTDYNFPESPISMGQGSCNFSYRGRSVNRKLWSSKNGGVDVSLKDGFDSGLCLGSNGSNTFVDPSDDAEVSETGDDHSEEFVGFVHSTFRDGIDQYSTPSPQKRRSQFDIDRVKIFTTPRRLIRSLQDQDDGNTDYFEKQVRRIESPSSCNSGWSPTSPLDGDGQSHTSEGYDSKSSETSGTDSLKEHSEHGQEQDASESPSSTGGLAAVPQLEVSNETDQLEVSHETDFTNKIENQSSSIRKRIVGKTSFIWMCAFLSILLAIIAAFMRLDDVTEGYNLPPT